MKKDRIEFVIEGGHVYGVSTNFNHRFNTIIIDLNKITKSEKHTLICLAKRIINDLVK